MRGSNCANKVSGLRADPLGADELQITFPSDFANMLETTLNAARALIIHHGSTAAFSHT